MRLKGLNYRVLKKGELMFMKSIEDVYRQQIRDLFDHGYSIETIALCMGLSERYVRDCVRANNKNEKNDDTSPYCYCGMDHTLDTNCVNLSLEKYEEMKNKLEQKEADISYLESEVKRLTDVITKLGIPGKIIDRIGVDIPLSCYWQDDLTSDKRKYRIAFEVNIRDLREK